MRNLNLDESILSEYLLDDFDTEDSSIISNELQNRLSGYDIRELEIGCGNGKFIVELAMNNKDKYFVGIEYSYKAAKKAVSKAYKRNIKNLTIIFGEANNVINKYLNGKYYFDKIYLNFPDPWPKKKHAGRRFVNPENLKEIKRILKSGGIFRIATDHPVYKRHVLRTMHEDVNFVWTAKCGDDWRKEPSDWVKTKYQQKAIREGRRPVFFDYKKI